jgi:hypothetical protein
VASRTSTTADASEYTVRVGDLTEEVPCSPLQRKPVDSGAVSITGHYTIWGGPWPKPLLPVALVRAVVDGGGFYDVRRVEDRAADHVQEQNIDKGGVCDGSRWRKVRLPSCVPR